MTTDRLRVIASGTFFCLLALSASPMLLGRALGPDAHVYSVTLALVALVAAVASALLLFRAAAPMMSLLLYGVGVCLSVELVMALFVQWYTGANHLPLSDPAFTFHPSLVGMPTPGYRHSSGGISIEHNSKGLRGPEIGPRDRRRIRVAAIGGSTTYGVNVSNEDTWTAELQRQLGERFEVLNCGVPGQSSAEHIITTALRLSELEPDYTLYYMGWNDLRNAHLADLRSDYSNFHFLEQYGSLQVEQGHRSHSAILFVVKWALVRLGELQAPRHALKDSRGTMSALPDERLERIYERNVKLLAAVSRTIGAEPIFVSQVLNRDFRAEELTTWWAPLVPTSAILTLNGRLNDVMQRAALVARARFIDATLDPEWAAEHFLDHGHFSPAGHRRFAQRLAAELRELPARCHSSMTGPCV